MKRILMLVGVLAVAGCVMMDGQKGAPALRAPEKLTVEYMTDPVGLDCTAPRLSWKLLAADEKARNLRQVAWQVLAASSPDNLNRNNGDLWDSGRVASGQSLNVPYGGAALKTSQRCWWKVRAWSQKDDAPSAWSAPASWVMGVVCPEDWKAQWIGANASMRPDFDLVGAKWICMGDAGAPAPGRGYFRKDFDAPEGLEGLPVVLAVAGDEECEVWINGEPAVKTQGHLSDPCRMRFAEVTRLVKPGHNFIAAMVVKEARQERPAGLLAALRFADGTSVVTDESWNVPLSVEVPDNWNKAEDLSRREDRALRGLATVAAEPDAAPWGKVERRVEASPPVFEKVFAVTKPLRAATLHITGLGLCEASLNGKRIGRKALDPAPARYGKRALYSAYDLTKEVSRGENRLNVLLGYGQHDVLGVAAWQFGDAPLRDFPRMMAQLELAYSDGTSEMVCSGATWRQVADTEVMAETVPTPDGWPEVGSVSLCAAQAVAPAGSFVCSDEEINQLADEQFAPPGWEREAARGSASLVVPWTRYVYQGDIRFLEKAYPTMAEHVDDMTARGEGDVLDAQIAARTAELLGKAEDAKKYAALARDMKEDRGGGSSHDHIISGDASVWWCQHLAGIRLPETVSSVATAVNPNEVAFKSFMIAPEPVKGLDWVKAEHDSPYGTIRSIWAQNKGIFCLEVEVPVNTVATVCLPAEPGTPGLLADVPTALPVNGRMTFKVGSGTYTFAVPLASGKRQEVRGK